MDWRNASRARRYELVRVLMIKIPARLYRRKFPGHFGEATFLESLVSTGIYFDETALREVVPEMGVKARFSGIPLSES